MKRQRRPHPLIGDAFWQRGPQEKGPSKGDADEWLRRTAFRDAISTYWPSAALIRTAWLVRNYG